MRANRIQSAKSLGFFVVASLLLLFTSCGGGTSGTGGSSGGGLTISGILSAGTQPLRGVTVSASTTTPAGTTSIQKVSQTISTVSAARDVTDDTGAFMLQIDNKPQALSLRFQGENFDVTYDLNRIPVTAVSVALELSIEEKNETISESSHRFEDNEGNEVLETISNH